MSSGLDAMTGVLPVMIIGGVLTNVTNSMFSQPKRRTTSKCKRKERRTSSVGFGNFRNVGL